jgi:hypothetical protein
MKKSHDKDAPSKNNNKYAETQYGNSEKIVKEYINNFIIITVNP